MLGLLYDSEGNRFTPSHAQKNGRQYRYYTCQTLLTPGKRQTTSPGRIPAGEIEELVTTQLRNLLQSPQRILNLFRNQCPDPDGWKFLLNSAATLSKDVTSAVPLLVRRVVGHKERIEILIDRAQLLKTLRFDPEVSVQLEVNATYTIEVPALIKRRGGEVRLQLSPDLKAAQTKPVPSLVRAVARANDWVDRVLHGELDNVRTIAKQTGFDERYVSRILPLAFLSPEITEAIVDGRHDSDLAQSLSSVPLNWCMQRR